MSAYNPPIENVPIFDSSLFRDTNSDGTLTITQADKRYLRFPIAQGNETLQGATITGALTASNSVSFTSTTSPPVSSGIISAGDNSTKMPTTAWVQGEIATAVPIHTYQFTTTGNYTQSKPTGATHLKAICIGAGGGGGGGVGMGAPSGGSKGGNGGAGGGGGGITIVDIDLTTETSFTINVGAGGSAGSASTGANAGNGGVGGDCWIRCIQNNLFYAYSTGGQGGQGATNQLAPNNTLQASGGLGGSGSQGVGGSGGKGVGLNSPTDQNTGFIFTGINGSQSALIGAGGGGGGGAIYMTSNAGGGQAVYFDAYGGAGGSLGYTLSATISQGGGAGGGNSGGNGGVGSGVLGFGGGGSGGGGGSRYSGSGTLAGLGGAGIYGSGGGGGGSDHTNGRNGGKGGDAVCILFFT